MTSSTTTILRNRSIIFLLSIHLTPRTAAFHPLTEGAAVVGFIRRLSSLVSSSHFLLLFRRSTIHPLPPSFISRFNVVPRFSLNAAIKKRTEWPWPGGRTRGWNQGAAEIPAFRNYGHTAGSLHGNSRYHDWNDVTRISGGRGGKKIRQSQVDCKWTHR